MQGITFAGDRQIEMMEFADPKPGFGEVVIEIKASGMCGTDLRYFRPKKGERTSNGIAAPTAPVIMGHEPCGIVAEVGPGVDPRQAKVGDRVMVHHYQGCTQCEYCRSGWQQLCQKQAAVVYGNNQNGGHAPYMLVPANTLVPLPDELSFEAGAAISCGTGTAYGALTRMRVSGRDTIAIHGQGPVGLSATQFASAMGARVIALDVSPSRLQRAKEFGADILINPTEVEDVVAAVKDVTHGLGADISLDTSSALPARLAGVRSTKVWGTMCFVGEGGEPLTIDVSRDMLRRQMTLIGSWTFSTIIQADCARFVVDRGVDVDALFTDRWSFNDAQKAYDLFDRQTEGKGVFLN